MALFTHGDIDAPGCYYRNGNARSNWGECAHRMGVGRGRSLGGDADLRVSIPLSYLFQSQQRFRTSMQAICSASKLPARLLASFNSLQWRLMKHLRDAGYDAEAMGDLCGCLIGVAIGGLARSKRAPACSRSGELHGSRRSPCHTRSPTWPRDSSPFNINFVGRTFPLQRHAQAGHMQSAKRRG